MYVFKRKRRRGGKLSESINYYGRFLVEGESVERVVKLGTRFKDVGEQKLRDFARQAEREILGIAPPRPLVDAASRPLADHLVEFIADLKLRGRSPGYVYNVKRHVEIIAAACGWVRLRDVNADGFTTWRASLSGKSAKTLNEYLNYCNALLNWLTSKGRLVANPLKTIGKVSGEEVRNRRAINDRQAVALLEVSGPRRLVYLTALLTGLRRRELRTLAWSDLHLDGISPHVTLRRKNEKNRRGSVLPLRDDLVSDLLAARAVSSKLLVFGTSVPRMDAFRADLMAAGIVYRDDLGRVFDFHSIRHTFGTNLSRAGVPLIQAMHLMRHSDPKLTSRVYTDSRELPVMDAVNSLPTFRADDRASERMIATGTDGTVRGTETSVQTGLRLSTDVEGSDGSLESQMPSESAVTPNLASDVQHCLALAESWGSRIRT